jgi:hypothetical protein
VKAVCPSPNKRAGPGPYPPELPEGAFFDAAFFVVVFFAAMMVLL